MSGSVTAALLDLIAHQKDDEAYRLLYSHFHPPLLRFAIGYLKTKEPAEEVVNDVIYRVWSKKAGIADIQNLRIYLFTAVRNACLSQLARVKKDREFADKFTINELSSDDPESVLISAELSNRIKATISALPPRCRQIYEMIRVEGLRNKDVAEQLRISVNTIDAQLAIALKRLVKTVDAFMGRKVSRKI